MTLTFDGNALVIVIAVLIAAAWLGATLEYLVHAVRRHDVDIAERLRAAIRADLHK